MRHFPIRPTAVFLYMILCGGWSIAVGQSPAKPTATIQRISMLTGNGLELEIAASGPLTPQPQLITGPDRLILDFPNSIPAKALHNLEINRGDITDARIGIFSSTPPVTRIVLDLKSPKSYQLFPSGNTLVVKFGGNSFHSEPTEAPETIISIERTPIIKRSQAPPPAPQPIAAIPAKPASGVEVVFANGLLSIRSNKANLSEVLFEVRRRTGAEIAIPSGAESEQVFTNLGPGPPKEVLASLLNGSHFNFIVIGNERDPGGIRQVVLTPKQGGISDAVVYPCGTTQPAVAQYAPEPPQQQAFVPAPPPDQPDPNNAAPMADQPPPQQQ